MNAHIENRIALRWLSLGLLAGILANIFSAITLSPVPFTDNPFFVATAVNHALGHGLVNPALSTLGYNVLSADDPRFVMHGPLFPLAMSWLAVTADARGVYLAMAFMRILTLILSASLIYALTTRRRLGPPHLVGLCGAVCVAAQAGMSMPPTGRPESLSALLLAASFACLYLAPPTAGRFMAAGLIGLTGATQPIAAALFCLGYAAWTFSTQPWRKASRSFAVFGLSSIAVCTFVLSLSPFGLQAHLSGMAEAGARDAAREGGSLIRYYLFWWDRTFFGPAFFGGLVAATVALLGKYPRTRVRFLTVVVVVAAAVWYSGLRLPKMSYNLSQFQPLAYFMILWAAAEAASAAKKRLSHFLILALLILASPSLLAYVKFGTEYLSARETGRDYDSARQALREVLPRQARVVCPGRLWVLFDDPSNLRFVLDGSDIDKAIDAADGPVNIVLGSWPDAPMAEIARLREEGLRVDVLLDYRAKKRPSIFGMKVTSFDSGYSFVALRARKEDFAHSIENRPRRSLIAMRADSPLPVRPLRLPDLASRRPGPDWLSVLPALSDPWPCGVGPAHTARKSMPAWWAMEPGPARTRSDSRG